jgi:3-oxoacyl-[acyl-carrier protein] reductase
MTRKALVVGGTGTVGAAVLRELAGRGVAAAFTFHRNEARARALASELGHTAFAIDLADPVALRPILDAQPAPDVVICCAGITASPPLVELDPAAWQRAVAVNVGGPLEVCRWVASGRTRPTDVVIVGGLDRTQSLPLPVGYAATQGALSAMVMALGHELGPAGIRINMVSLGVLEGGTSRDLQAQRLRDYEKFSSLRRVGTAAEAAKVIAWLALENTYIQGKVVPVNGGI